MRRSLTLFVVATLMLTLVAGLAQAKGKPDGKGKPEGKGNPVVTYVFKGKVASVDQDSAVVSVEKGNSFARSYAGQQVDFSVNDSTKVVEDDQEATLSDLDADDRALVQVRAPKSGATDLTAGKIVAESPVAYYSDADGDGIGADEPKYYFAGEQPEDYVGTGGDNCADVANPDQSDADGDGIGDACDDVDDGSTA